ncbi:MAG: Amidase, partial [Pseudonocardiales bacterium]|nr:Amidase [Pseudonocardiales bacterium]
DVKAASGAPTGPLYGVPYVVKELTAMEGERYAFGLKPLAGTSGERTAEVPLRSKAAALARTWRNISEVNPACGTAAGSSPVLHTTRSTGESSYGSDVR